MSVSRFTVPGYSTRRDFAVYVVVARKRRASEFYVYVGKTGDNRDGCNPVISRAGNHFSHNDVHSQVRNKLPLSPDAYDFEYFYVTFGSYNGSAVKRRAKVNVVNEMERATNQALRDLLSEPMRARLLNEYKGTGYVGSAKRLSRTALRTSVRMKEVNSLSRAVMKYLVSFAPSAAKPALKRTRKKPRAS